MFRFHVNLTRAVVIGSAFCAASSWAGARERFIDYYTTAASMIQTVNIIAADIEALNLRHGAFSDEEAVALRARLVKAREGFAAVLPTDDHTNELNEGYILYIDKMILAITVARECQADPDGQRRARLDELLDEGGALLARLNQTVAKDKRTYGLD